MTSPSPTMPERVGARRASRAASPCGRGGCSRRAGRARCRRSARRPPRVGGSRRAAGGRRSRPGPASARRARARALSSAASSSKVASTGSVDVRPVEEPESELHPQDPRRPPRRATSSSTRPSARAAASGAPYADGSWQLGVDAGGERQPGRLAEVRRQLDGPWRSSRRRCSPRRRCRRSPTRRAGSPSSSSVEAWQGTPSTSQ